MKLSDAVALHRAGQLDQAETAYRQIIAGEAAPAALSNLGALVRQRDPEEALQLLQRAIAASPPLAAAHRNLGNLHRDCGRPSEAEAAYARAAELDPSDDETATSLAEARLAQGKFASAWPLLDRRRLRRRELSRGFPFPEWQGEPLAGKRLLVWPEQGFGDQILMARFLRELDGRATVVCQAALIKLFQALPVDIRALEPRMDVGGFDYWALPFSLPGRLGAPEPPTTAYLQGQAVRRGGVGLVWRGNASPDPERSMPGAIADQLLALPDVVSLQPEDTGAADFQATADLMASLDLVISIDTASAHLAGALGLPTIVLHKHAPLDWRWRTDPAGRSCWYPSAEVLRQPSPGDWISIVAELERRLKAR